MSTRWNSASAVASCCNRSVTSFRVKTRLPAPTMAIFVMTTPFSVELWPPSSCKRSWVFGPRHPGRTLASLLFSVQNDRAGQEARMVGVDPANLGELFGGDMDPYQFG
jgi:hypothetical protein